VQQVVQFLELGMFAALGLLYLIIFILFLLFLFFCGGGQQTICSVAD
jgi:hypothetical protein